MITAYKPVGIWIRVSTEDQARGESPEHHEKCARYYADSRGWRVLEVYHLEATSGKIVKEYFGTGRVIADIKKWSHCRSSFFQAGRLARNT